MKKYKRIFLIVMDSLGVGAMKDAHKYGDEGANTLQHILDVRKYLHVPTLNFLGIGDFVNGKRVDNVSDGMIALEYCEECNLWGEVIDDESKIKSVLTKAQYENDCLKEA